MLTVSEFFSVVFGLPVVVEINSLRPLQPLAYPHHNRHLSPSLDTVSFNDFLVRFTA